MICMFPRYSEASRIACLLKRSVKATVHVLTKFNLDEQKGCDFGRARKKRPAGLYMSSRLNSFRGTSLNPDAMARVRGLYRAP